MMAGTRVSPPAHPPAASAVTRKVPLGLLAWQNKKRPGDARRARCLRSR